MSFGFGPAFPYWYTLAVGFSPAALFAAGEQGAWYDPSDFSTLFQDPAGTTPVTAVEQAVGRMLDKSGRGNHATAYNSGAARPILRARYNRLERTEEISNVYWTKTQLASFSASGVTPNGVTAFNLIPNTNSDSHRLAKSAINIAGPKTMRVVAKANGYNFLAITDLTTFSAGINLTTGAQFGGAGTAVVTSLGNGWWEIEVSGTATASTSYALEPLPSASFAAYAGDGVSGVLVGEFDDRFTADAALNIPAYQRIGAATDYDTSGFPVYLLFDGFDDSMLLPAISGVSGVTGIIGASTNSINTSSNPYDGQSVISAYRPGSSKDYGIGFRRDTSNVLTAWMWVESTATGLEVRSSSTVNVGQSYVLTGTGSVTSTNLRVNGAAAGTGSGTVNDLTVQALGQDPTMGAAQPFFNGRAYSILFVSRILTASEIQATERWIAGKMKLSI